MTDYTTLIAAKSTAGSIKSYAVDDSLPVETIIAEAVDWIVHEGGLRVREMQSTATVTLSSAASEVDLPERFIGLQSARFVSPDDFGLVVIDPGRLEEYRRYTTGTLDQTTPTQVAVDGTQFAFDYAADQTHLMRARFWQEPPTLSTDTTTNVLTNRFPALLRDASLAFAMGYRKRYGEKEQMLGMLRGKIDNIHAREQLNQGPVVAVRATR